MKKQKNENVSYLSEVLDKLKEHKIAMAVLIANILTDVAYGILDPRISYK